MTTLCFICQTRAYVDAKAVTGYRLFQLNPVLFSPSFFSCQSLLFLLPPPPSPFTVFFHIFTVCSSLITTFFLRLGLLFITISFIFQASMSIFQVVHLSQWLVRLDVANLPCFLRFLGKPRNCVGKFMLRFVIQKIKLLWLVTFVTSCFQD